MKGKKLLVLAAASLLGTATLVGCGNGSGGSGGGGGGKEPKGASDTNGVFSYVNESGAERTKILGILEQYAVEEKLTGLTIFNNGGYVLYSPSVRKGANNYIPGYGFGVLGDGEITADLAGETNESWKRYLHSYLSEDPASLNYMDDKGSVVGDLIGYVNSAYFDAKMNETKDGYEWKGVLAKQDRPEAMNKSSATGLATKFRFEVKVGSEMKYTTLSSKYSQFNDREVALEDYLTPYKIYYTKAYGMARGSENLSGAGSIKGASSYYNASGKGFNQEKWDKLGIKAYVEGGKSYLEFELNTACNEFFAMYYLSSGMFAPVPEDFIKAIGNGDFAAGVKAWGKNSEDLSENILDHWLSTGPYTLERWDNEQQIVFKRNANFVDGNRYKVAGVHLNILKAINNDPEAALKEFLADKLHSCGIPSTQLDKYISDPRATKTEGDSNFKINMNTCTQEVWDSLFGLEGSIDQISDESEAWVCEPAMSNPDFVSGISFAINRQEYAAKLGRNPAFEYFADTYLSDPENGVVYNDTDEHKAAVASIAEGTDGYGYSLELAKASFKKAAETLIEEGVYNKGDTIEIEIAWQTAADEQLYHAPIAKYLTDAFNTQDNPLHLEVKFWVGQKWSDVYYSKMMLGQYDLGFGSVSGNSYNPLNFLEVLKSDNSSGFTLNWGTDTNAIDNDHLIQYDGYTFSFDALWTAADQGAYVKEGKNAQVPVSVENVSVTRNQDGTLTLEGDFLEPSITGDDGAELYHAAVSDIHVYDGVTGIDLPIVREDFDEASYSMETGITHIKVTFDAETAAELDNPTTAKYAAYGYFMFDVYYAKTVLGSEGAPAIGGSIYVLTGVPAVGESAPEGAVIGY